MNQKVRKNFQKLNRNLMRKKNLIAIKPQFVFQNAIKFKLIAHSTLLAPQA
jgi:hypothetical protein